MYSIEYGTHFLTNINVPSLAYVRTMSYLCNVIKKNNKTDTIMNENINLYKLLKGHNGEKFYSPLCGDVILDRTASENNIYFSNGGISLIFYSDGSYFKNGECLVFPSKTQRDWNKWAEGWIDRDGLPKTWDEYLKGKNHDDLCLIDRLSENVHSPSEKSALAFLKIYRLIEDGYGGNVTNEDWKNIYINKYVIKTDLELHLKLSIFRLYSKNIIAFRSYKCAEEFLSHTENVQLLKDYFMIN